MKILKSIGLGLLILIVLLVVVAYLLPRHVKIERTATIKAAPEIVFGQINVLKNWEQWSPWYKIDPKMKLTYNDIPSGKGASYSWQSKDKNVGNGTLTITRIVPYDTIDLEMNFMEQGAVLGGYYFKKKADSTVQLAWWMEADMGNNPIGRWMGLFMNRLVGKDFEKGLDAIKTISERLGNLPLTLETTTEKPSNYLYIHKTGSEQEIGKFFMESYPALAKYISEKGAKSSGPPFALYYKWENDHFDLDICMPVNKILKGDQSIKSGKLKGGKILTVKYYGPYEGTGRAHAAAMKWIQDNKNKIDGAAREVYVTDPMTEKDPAKVLTLIVYPIKKI
ncbi:MAG: GyrI-like domain-containing protein [Bacteroidota bacterium]|nr:GyrI-like domain-containing protein [Bacteroidota bacterium]